MDREERGAIATLRITPSFEPRRSLSVVDRGRLGFVIRSVRFARRARSELSNASAPTEPPIVREVKLDVRTAKIVRALWVGLSARSQAEKDDEWETADGTDYELRSGPGDVHVDSPSAGSVLGDVAVAFDHFERVVEGRSLDSEAELARAHDLLEECLERTRRREPCWRFHEG